MSSLLSIAHAPRCPDDGQNPGVWQLPHTHSTICIHGEPQLAVLLHQNSLHQHSEQENSCVQVHIAQGGHHCCNAVVSHCNGCVGALRHNDVPAPAGSTTQGAIRYVRAGLFLPGSAHQLAARILCQHCSQAGWMHGLTGLVAAKGLAGLTMHRHSDFPT